MYSGINTNDSVETVIKKLNLKLESIPVFNSNNYYNRTEINNIIKGYIPLSGTLANYPVMGNIEFSPGNNIKLYSNDSSVMLDDGSVNIDGNYITLSSINNNNNVLINNGQIFLNSGNFNNRKFINLSQESNYIALQSNVDGAGLVGQNYYGNNYVDNSFVQKKFVIDTFNNIDLSNYYTKSETNSLLQNYYLKTETYSKNEVNSFLNLKADSSQLNNYYTKNEVDVLFNQTYNYMNNFFVDYDNTIQTQLLNYYTKSETFSQTEINNLLNNKQNNLGYTPENIANKSDSYTSSSSTTYASTKALVDGLATKADLVDGKVPKAQSQPSTMVMDNSTYVITFTDATGAIQTIDLPLESLFQDANYDETTKSLIVTLQDGTTRTIPLSDLVDLPEIVLATSNPAVTPTSGQKVYFNTSLGKVWFNVSGAWVFGGNLISDTEKTNLSTAYNHSQTTGNPHNTTKSDIGLGNVDNTSDLDKPISTATQNALNTKADLAVVNNLQIGGRNLFGFNKGVNFQINTIDKSINGYVCNYTSDNTLGRITNLGLEEIGGDFVVSLYIKANKNVNVNVNLCDVYTSNSIVSLTTVYVKHIFYFKNVYQYTGPDMFGFLDIECSDISAKVFVKDLKIERGNKATDWTPAPEDKQDRLQDITGNIGVGKPDVSATEKLDVNGNVRISQSLTGGSSTPSGTSFSSYSIDGGIGNYGSFNFITRSDIDTNSLGMVGINLSPEDGVNLYSYSLDYGKQSYIYLDPYSSTIQSGGDIGFRTKPSTTYQTSLIIKKTGNVGIGTISPSYPLHVATQVSNTSIYAAYDIVAFSDISVKNNIRPIDNVLERVINSRGVLYDRIDSGEKNNIGFIAQELEEQFPELIVENPDGTKAVKYQNAVAILFEAIKEQQKQINELKNGITK